MTTSARKAKEEGAASSPPSLRLGEAVRAYLGLGSNLGDRAQHLQRAVGALVRRPGLQVLRSSPVYESEAHTLRAEDVQQPYLNAVLEVATLLSPSALLEVCLGVEHAAGRDRAREGRWGARSLDIDLLVYDALTVREAGLTVPHPRLAERRFVVQPLADLAPNLHVPPPFDASVGDLLARCPDEAALVPTDIVLYA